MALSIATAFRAPGGRAKVIAIRAAESVGEQEFAAARVLPAIDAKLAGATAAEIQIRFFMNLLAKRER